MEIEKPSQTGFTAYCKSNCSYCVKVKQLLSDNKIFYVEINCDDYLVEDKEAFLSFIKNVTGIDHRTFPMVFTDGKFIGGFTDTEVYVCKQQLSFNEDNF